MLVLEERVELHGTAHPMGMQGSRRDDGMNMKRKECTSNNKDVVEIIPTTTKMDTKTTVAEVDVDAAMKDLK